MIIPIQNSLRVQKSFATDSDQRDDKKVHTGAIMVIAARFSQPTKSSTTQVVGSARGSQHGRMLEVESFAAFFLLFPANRQIRYFNIHNDKEEIMLTNRLKKFYFEEKHAMILPESKGENNLQLAATVAANFMSLGMTMKKLR